MSLPLYLHIYTFVCEGCSVLHSFQPHGLQLSRLLCPWNSPGQNIGQLFPSPGGFPNPGIELRSPSLQVDSLPSEPPGKPTYASEWLKLRQNNEDCQGSRVPGTLIQLPVGNWQFNQFGKQFADGSGVKNQLAMQELQEMWIGSMGQEDPLKEQIATHSSILAWKIPWIEKPGGLCVQGITKSWM